jgi:predicted Zn-dependent protease with MMP-like domain
MSADIDEGLGEIDFEREVDDAVAALPRELRDVISNVEIVVEEEPPPGQPLLGLYQGIPLTRRGSGYTGVLPDKITIYRGLLERLYGADRESLRRQIRRVVLHEVAHHFGISDERLEELGRRSPRSGSAVARIAPSGGRSSWATHGIPLAAPTPTTSAASRSSTRSYV